MLLVSTLGYLSRHYHGRRMVQVLLILIVVPVMSREMRLLVELLLVVCVFGIFGHGMIVLYKGKGSPTIKRSSSRRGVGNLNRQHWRLLLVSLMMLMLVL